MRFHPDDLRSRRLIFLLDLTWGGQVYRVADDACTPTLDGVALTYTDGLEWQGTYEDQVALFGAAAPPNSVQLTLHMQELVDVPATIEAGYPLGAASARLSLWVEGTAEARVLLDGEVRLSSYGGADDPVEITVEEDPLLSPGRVPGEGKRLQAPADYDATAETVVGQWYPVVFGRPGGSAVGRYGSPALIRAFNDPSAGWATAVVSAERCVDGYVFVLHADSSVESFQQLRWEYDSTLGFGRTTVRLDPGDLTVEDAAYYINWWDLGVGTAGAGVPSRRDPDVPMRGAGEILAWLVEKSGARADFGRLAALEPLLAAFRLDFAIVPGDGEAVSPLEWVEDHLLPLLPLSARRGPLGLHYVYWRWGATAQDAEVHFSTVDGTIARIGDVEYSDRGELYQEIRLNYYYDHASDTHDRSLTYTGDRGLQGNTRTVVDPYLEAGWRLYARGQRLRARTLTISTEVITEDATAHLVLQFLARRHGLQTRLVRYEAPPEFAHVEAGTVVTITDPEVSLSDAVAVVEAAEPSSQGTFGLALRLLPRLG